MKYVTRYLSILAAIFLNLGCYLNTSIVSLKEVDNNQESQPVIDAPEVAPVPAELSKYKSIAPLSSQARLKAKAEFGDFVLFEGGDSINGRELWKLNKSSGMVSLVKDICKGEGSSDIFFLQPFDGDYYFFANDCIHGMELWKTDGTELGTKLVKDIEPGAKGSYDSNYYLYIDSDKRGIVFGGRYFFGAQTTSYGTELWSTDGTEVGTELTYDIFVGSGHSEPREYVILNSKIYFIAENSVSGAELWSSDGTSTGTSLVKDIYPGLADSFASNLIVLGSNIIFTARDGVNGQELFRSDGTEAGTFILKNIRSGSASSTPQSFIKLGSKIIFTARESTSYQPWATDGTSLGTVKLINQSYPLVWNNLYKELNGKLYFVATTASLSGLYETDGTPGGTILIKDNISIGINPFIAEVVNNKLVFFCSTVAAGDEFCVTDGTTLGTTVLKDIMPGTSGITSSSFALVPSQNGNSIFLGLADGISGVEPWITDGTEMGTHRIKDIAIAESDSSPVFLTSYLNQFYFFASGKNSIPQIWKTDGSEGGTTLVQNSPTAITRILADVTASVLADKLFMTVYNNEYGTELWISDGTTSGTSMIRDINDANDSSVYHLNPVVSLGSEVFFNATNLSYGNGELWKSNGTTAGTQLVKDINPGSVGSMVSYLAKSNNKILFLANDGVVGNELWISDGTEIGTHLVVDLNPGAGSSIIAAINAFANGFIFINQTAGAGNELWITDGTAGGTGMIKDINPGVGNSVDNLFMGTEYQGYLYFGANDGTNGLELWRTDGTSLNTQMVKNINPTGSSLSSQKNFLIVNNKIIFSANNGTSGMELFVSDGTGAGTELVKDINTGVGNGFINMFGKFPNKESIVFTANDGVHGSELWVSDGTADGTRMIKDILSGGGSVSIYTKGAFLNDRFYFFADDGVHGVELWSTDGTEVGTKIEEEYIKGKVGRDTTNLSIYSVGGKIYIVGSDISGVMQLFTFDP